MSRAYLRDPDWFDRTYHWLHDNMGGNADARLLRRAERHLREPAADP